MQLPDGRVMNALRTVIGASPLADQLPRAAEIRTVIPAKTCASSIAQHSLAGATLVPHTTPARLGRNPPSHQIARCRFLEGRETLWVGATARRTGHSNAMASYRGR